MPPTDDETREETVGPAPEREAYPSPLEVPEPGEPPVRGGYPLTLAARVAALERGDAATVSALQDIRVEIRRTADELDERFDEHETRTQAAIEGLKRDLFELLRAPERRRAELHKACIGVLQTVAEGAKDWRVLVSLVAVALLIVAAWTGLGVTIGDWITVGGAVEEVVP